MESKDLPEALSAAVLQFCQDHVQYTGHLSVHGSITLIADSTTTIGFFSKKLPEKSEVDKEIQERNCYQSFVGNLSHTVIRDTAEKVEESLLPTLEDESSALVCENVGGATLGLSDGVQRWATRTDLQEYQNAVLETIRKAPSGQAVHLENTFSSAAISQPSHLGIMTGQAQVKTEKTYFDEDFGQEVAFERSRTDTNSAKVTATRSSVTLPSDIDYSFMNNGAHNLQSSAPDQITGIAHSSSYPSWWDKSKKRFSQKVGKGAYRCQFCVKQFKTSYRLTRHVRTHTGEKPYPCDHCGKRFTQQEHLRSHKLTHLVVKPFKCEGCQKVYTTRQSLFRHEQYAKISKNWDCCQSATKARLLGTETVPLAT